MSGHHITKSLLELGRAGFHACGGHLLLGDFLRQWQILLIVSANAILHHTLRGVIKDHQHLIRRRIVDRIVHV